MTTPRKGVHIWWLMKKRALPAAAVSAALIFCVTMLRFPLASSGGYVHLGDALVYLCASLLPFPYASAAGAVGGVLADVLGGAAVWTPATLVLKAVQALLFCASSKTVLCRRNVLASLLAGAVTVAGYYGYEALLTHSLTVPLVSAGGNALQAVASAVLFWLLGAALDRLKAKDHLYQ